jgi:uncharacterized membrane protein (Fun14 family)
MGSLGFDIGGADDGSLYGRCIASGVPARRFAALSGSGPMRYYQRMEHDQTASGPLQSGEAVARRAARSLVGSKSLWTAILITVLGAVSWGYAAFTRPAPDAANLTAPSSSFAERSADASVREIPPGERLIDKSAPRTVRYGLSFIAAFIVAFFVKKFIKSVLLIAGLLVAAIAALKYFGLFEYDWNAAQQQVEQGVELARQESGRVAKVVSEYLPSSVAGGLGAVFGARRG